MNWLVPLGFLGLLGLLALLLIYLIKPNFQKKSVSSTYVWKLSFRFQKKRNPITRVQDILLLICQILAIVALAFIFSTVSVLSVLAGDIVLTKVDPRISLSEKAGRS